MKKLVIFDLDGTLLNSVADLAIATNYALEQLGFCKHDIKDYRFFVGNGIDKLFERALPEDARTLENIRRVRELFIPYYNVHNTDLTRPYAGIVELLEHLQAQNICLAVASNKYQEATRQLVAHFFSSIHFSEVCGQCEGIARKPNPAIVYGILSKLGISASDTLYVGDSGIDMQTAKNAGVDAIGVTWGFRPRAELEAFSPFLIADSPEDVQQLF
jgi:phosphoglycolate phosphatase